MLPTLNLGFVELPSYAVFVSVGLLAAARLAFVRANADGLDPRRVLLIGVVGTATGLVGARLWSAAFEVVRSDPSLTLLEILGAGGLSVIGAMLGGVAGMVAGARLLPPRGGGLSSLDAIAPGAALAIAFGRVGCLFSGCCHGQPTLFPVALVYQSFEAGVRPVGVPLHATPIYEAIGCVVIAAVLWRVPSRLAGLRFASLCLGYGLLRAALEPLRGDWRGEVLGWPVTQLGAMVMAVAAALFLIGLAFVRRRGDLRGRENDRGSSTPLAS